jgi:hypothetical protein
MKLIMKCRSLNFTKESRIQELITPRCGIIFMIHLSWSKDKPTNYNEAVMDPSRRNDLRVMKS